MVSGGNSLAASWSAVSGAEWYQFYVIQPPPAGPGGGALTVAAREVVGHQRVGAAGAVGRRQRLGGGLHGQRLRAVQLGAVDQPGGSEPERAAAGAAARRLDGGRAPG